jgi:hypothetical protein
LALAQVARAADFLHLSGHSQPGLRRRIGGALLHRNWPELDRFLDVEGPMAPSAQGIARPELNQLAVRECAADNFARFHAYRNSCHGWCAECQSKVSAVHQYTTIVATF